MTKRPVRAPLDRDRAADRIVPRAQREPVVDRTGAVLRGARIEVETTIAGSVRITRRNVISSLHSLGRSRGTDAEGSMITARHVAAAEVLLRDWDEVGAGIAPPPLDLLRTGGSGGGHEGQILRLAGQVATRDRLAAALAHCGTHAPILHAVVLSGVSVRVCAIGMQVNRRQLVGYLAGALDRLIEFYEARGMKIVAFKGAKARTEDGA